MPAQAVRVAEPVGEHREARAVGRAPQHGAAAAHAAAHRPRAGLARRLERAGAHDERRGAVAAHQARHDRRHDRAQPHQAALPEQHVVGHERGVGGARRERPVAGRHVAHLAGLREPQERHDVVVRHDAAVGRGALPEVDRAVVRADAHLVGVVVAVGGEARDDRGEAVARVETAERAALRQVGPPVVPEQAGNRAAQLLGDRAVGRHAQDAGRRLRVAVRVGDVWRSPWRYAAPASSHAIAVGYPRSRTNTSAR